MLFDAETQNALIAAAFITAIAKREQIDLRTAARRLLGQRSDMSLHDVANAFYLLAARAENRGGNPQALIREARLWDAAKNAPGARNNLAQ